MVTDYGEGLRRVLLRESRIDEVYDFRDSGVFEDATNYPAIVILEDEPDEAAREDNEIRCVRVKSNTDNESGRDLDEAIIASVRENRGDAGYSDDFIDVFDYPQRKLSGEEYWPLMPPEELQVFERLESESDSLVSEVTDDVSHGTQTSANTVYVVDVLDAERVESGDAGETVTVIASGGTEEYKIETDLLRPWLQGRDVQRWRAEWSGQHVVLPYHIENDEDTITSSLIGKETLRGDYPLAWDFFKSHEKKLRGREGGRWEGSDEWWEFGRPQNLEKFEIPKIIFAHISEDATFMLDEVGTWYYKTAYSVLLSKDYRDLTEVIACQLNSKALDFYFKHITTVKMGGFYEYRSQYVEKLPCITEDRAGVFDTMRDRAGEIIDNIDLDSKTDRFPEAYLGEYDGQLDYITYEWQTRRYPINADVQGDVDGEFTVQAGRSDTINHPAMYSDDREARRRRAEYVCTAVNGRNAKSGEEMTIPIPQSDDGVEELLDRLEADKREVEQTDIDGLEAEIDEAVYDLFDLTDDEREVIEEYLEVF
jgi:hypothetical protein